MGGPNPRWSRDELIVALDLYMRHRESLPPRDGREVASASKLLITLGARLGLSSDNFRNANSVYMKLGNFRSIDPLYTNKGFRGLPRGGKGDAEVWADFAERPRELALAAAAIRDAVASEKPIELSSESEVIEAVEGRLLASLHIRRERDTKLVTAKKSAALRDRGRLVCEACEFEFAAVYGERGAGYIEAHHIQPLHTLRPGSRTRLEDLALLCSNCHRIIHARKPWLTVPELRTLLAENRNGR